MFHAGHIHLLEQAKSLGYFVIVGIHSDAVVNNNRGMNLPIMNLNERVLSVLGCKFVDDVLIDAPYIINKDMITSLKINAVMKGTVEPTTEECYNNTDLAASNQADPYAVPREMGILHTLDSSEFGGLTVLDIVSRVSKQKNRYIEKFEKKNKAEKEFWHGKHGSNITNAANNSSFTSPIVEKKSIKEKSSKIEDNMDNISTTRSMRSRSKKNI